MVKKSTRFLVSLAFAATAALVIPGVSLRAETGEGESVGTCKATADCFKTQWNDTTKKWEDVKTGSVECTGDKSCTSGSEYVECDGTRGTCAV